MSSDEERDRDYVPSNSENLENSDDMPTLTKRARKRTRNPNKWKRNVAQILRNSGQEYIGSRGVVHAGKSVKVYEHTCRYKCSENFSEEARRQIFTGYWDLGKKRNGWDLQTTFITSCVKKHAPKMQRQNSTNQKNFSTCITLKEKRVCKQFFLSTLDISRKRFCNVVKNKKESGIAHTDQRGRHPPGNKFDEASLKMVKEHINSFPRYVSHYTRRYNPNRKYLAPELNVSKMYKLYKEVCMHRIEQPVKLSKYREVFNTQFNLSFRKPYSDTCLKCDTFKIKKDASDPQSEESMRISQEHALHLRKAEAARASKTSAKVSAKEFPERRAIWFDLQKTLPTPYLTCSKVYYLRQLWTYNLGIHDLVTGVGTMYMWHEAEGSKGSQDVMSCLLKYIENLPETVTHIDAFSDNCGGQNKNKNIIKFWMYIVENTQIKTVDHRFLISGHSFMECDQDFAVIEKVKRKLTHVFTPEDWVSVVAGASRKFIVVKMQPNDFKSISPMNNFTKANFVGVSKMQWLHFKKDEPYKLFYKEIYNTDFPFEVLDFKKNKKVACGRPARMVLPLLYEKPRRINVAKYNNLMELLPYIPPINHDFYKRLLHTGGGQEVVTDGNDSDDFGEHIESDDE